MVGAVVVAGVAVAAIGSVRLLSHPVESADAALVAEAAPGVAPTGISDALAALFPPADPVEADVGDASLAASRCVALESALASLMAVADAGDDGGCGWRPDRFDVACKSFEEGDAEATWGFHARAVTVDPTSCEWSAVFDLERFRGGASLRLADASYAVVEGMYTKYNRLEIDRLADYDGDGVEEVLVHHDWRFHEGGDEHRVGVFTVKQGAVVSYPPAASLRVVSAEDVDHDGRPDLWLRGPYERVEATDHLGNDRPMAPVAILAHALPGGTFSMTDHVAKSASLRVCPAKPKLAFTATDLGYPGDVAAHDIVCARLWGATQAEVDAAIAAACTGIDGDIERCDTWAPELAAVTPPFTLP